VNRVFCKSVTLKLPSIPGVRHLKFGGNGIKGEKGGT
jgi:hypothetical protein